MPRRFQFSIRLILVATAAVAAAVGAVAAPPSWRSISTLLLLGTAFTAAATGAVAAAGRIRVFWLGFGVAAALAAIVATAMVFGEIIDAVESNRWEDVGDSRLIKATSLTMAVLWCAGAINGVLCVFIHWLVWPNPPERG